MVDFRYHLVSLIAVFMALGVGVILGAGPLQNSIGSVLTDQVDSLRDSRNEAWAQAEASQREANAYREGMEILSDDVIASTLDEQNVIIVALPGAGDDAIDLHSSNLEQAGATVTGTVRVTEDFFSPGAASYRNALSGQLDAYVEPADNPMGTLVRGFELIVTGEDANTATLTEVYQSSDNALIEVVDPITAPADAILFIGVTSEEGPDEPDTDRDTTIANATAFFDSVELPAVYTADGKAGTTLASVRSSSGVSTVDSPADATALINVPFAITQELAGNTVAWGIEDGAEVVVGAAAPLNATTQETQDPATEGDPATEQDPAQTEQTDPNEPTEGES